MPALKEQRNRDYNSNPVTFRASATSATLEAIRNGLLNTRSVKARNGFPDFILSGQRDSRANVREENRPPHR